MKELEKTTRISDKIEIVGQKEVPIEIQFIGSKTLKPGHTCFEINFSSGEIKPADFEAYYLMDKQAIGGVKRIKKVVIKENCYYTNSLNKKNVMKQLYKLLK